MSADEQGSTESEIKHEYIGLAESPVDNIRHSFRNNSYRKVNLLFQQSEVGPIIGKGGSNIKAIKEKSNCSLSFYSEAKRNRTLVITGDKTNIPCAVEQVALYLQDMYKNRNRISIFWLLQRDQALGLIGKEGCISKQIKQETQVALSVMFDNLDNSLELLVRLTGSPEELKLAVDLILRKYVLNTNRPFRFNRMGNASKQTEDKVKSHYKGPAQFRIDSTQSIKVGRDMAGAVIGRQGGNIAQIRKFSMANVKVITPKDENELATIIVSGRPASVARAFEKIEECIQIFLAQGSRIKAEQDGVAPNIRRKNKKHSDVIRVKTENIKKHDKSG